MANKREYVKAKVEGFEVELDKREITDQLEYFITNTIRDAVGSYQSKVAKFINKIVEEEVERRITDPTAVTLLRKQVARELKQKLSLP